MCSANTQTQGAGKATTAVPKSNRIPQQVSLKFSVRHCSYSRRPPVAGSSRSVELAEPAVNFPIRRDGCRQWETGGFSVSKTLRAAKFRQLAKRETSPRLVLSGSGARAALLTAEKKLVISNTCMAGESRRLRELRRCRRGGSRRSACFPMRGVRVERELGDVDHERVEAGQTEKTPARYGL